MKQYGSCQHVIHAALARDVARRLSQVAVELILCTDPGYPFAAYDPALQDAGLPGRKVQLTGNPTGDAKQ